MRGERPRVPACKQEVALPSHRRWVHRPARTPGCPRSPTCHSGPGGSVGGARTPFAVRTPPGLGCATRSVGYALPILRSASACVGRQGCLCCATLSPWSLLPEQVSRECRAPLLVERISDVLRAP